MNNEPEHLDLTGDFLRGYLECALWTAGTEEEDDCQTLQERFVISDFSLSSVQDAARDCAKFEQDNADDLNAFYEVHPQSPDGDSREAFAGHNFWLTRNGHGTGFWDRGAGEAGDRLTEASRKAGERYVYVGDDDKLYIA